MSAHLHVTTKISVDRHFQYFAAHHLRCTPFNMSYRLPPNAAPSSQGSVSDSDSCDDASDWASSLGEALHTQSLFDETILPTAGKAVEYDLATHGFDLRALCEKLGLEDYGRMRLINWIRKEVGGALSFVLGVDRG
jgi:hypothetical protein